MSLPDEMETLRDDISRLCERWWSGQLAGREQLAPQMLAYLLQRCLDSSSMVVDVTRLLLNLLY